MTLERRERSFFTEDRKIKLRKTRGFQNALKKIVCGRTGIHLCLSPKIKWAILDKPTCAENLKLPSGGSTA